MALWQRWEVLRRALRPALAAAGGGARGAVSDASAAAAEAAARQQAAAVAREMGAPQAAMEVFDR
jgi:hypothetical protein